MEFDIRRLDGDAPHNDNSTTFVCKATAVSLQGIPEFESAPDDEEKEHQNRGKAFVFAKHFGEGKEAEIRFLAACMRQGWKHIPTSLFDDRVRRVDCVVLTPRGFLVVDVKGAKRLRRSDPEPQFRFHWLELHATGSLFSGESRVLALEVGPGQFALFDKAKIRAWIKPLLQLAAPVPTPSQALFRPYQRAGKVKEWITLVDVSEMMSMCEGIIE